MYVAIVVIFRLVVLLPADGSLLPKLGAKINDTTVDIRCVFRARVVK
jgi:hypothetical protein